MSKIAEGPKRKYSSATGINNKGEVVGRIGIGAGVPFLYKNGQLTTLPIPAEDKVFINDAGQIAGTMQTKNQIFLEGRIPSVSSHAFLWSAGKLMDLGALKNESGAVALNNKGEVLGASETTRQINSPFIWRNGKMIDIGLQINQRGLRDATALNDHGDIVSGWLIKNGKCYNFKGIEGYPSPGAVLINNSGQVVVHFSRWVVKSGHDERQDMDCLLTPK